METLITQDEKMICQWIFERIKEIHPRDFNFIRKTIQQGCKEYKIPLYVFHIAYPYAYPHIITACFSCSEKVKEEAHNKMVCPDCKAIWVFNSGEWRKFYYKPTTLLTIRPWI